MKKKMNIALVGLGTIGSYLLKYLIQNKNQLIKEKYGYTKCSEGMCSE